VLITNALTWLWFTIFACALVAITLIDLRYTFVPDEISINGIWLALIGGFFLQRPEPLDHFFGVIVGYGIILMIRAIGFAIYRREAMGLGDAKLLAFIGGFLGWKVLPFILFAAAVQGLLAAVLALSYSRITGRANMLTLTSTELDERFGEEGEYEQQRVMLVMPFGPFLCIAAFEILMLGEATLWRWIA
jgi:prepilin signal peptidase PulO-like enzyme (type II secretory pathway)